MFDCWHNPELFDSRFEYAIRSWAIQSPEVSGEIGAADTIRLQALTDMFVRFDFSPHAADVRARTIYLTQIGYISMKTNETTADRMKRIPEYVEIFTGQAPETRELERFFARHGHSSEARKKRVRTPVTELQSRDRKR